jgi:transposase
MIIEEELNYLILIELLLCRDLFYRVGFTHILLAEGFKVKNFSKSLLHNKAKTDQQDAEVLAGYGRFLMERGKAKLYAPLSSNTTLLKELYARVVDLKDLKQKEKNRLKAPKLSPELKENIAEHLSFLLEQLAALKAKIDSIIKQDPELSLKYDFLLKQKGIGQEIGQLFISELPELGKVSRRTIASISGLAPCLRDSGTIRGYHSTRGGRPLLKQKIFLCVLSMLRYKKDYQERIAFLQSRGKRKMVAIVALMRKFMIVLNGMMREELRIGGIA